MDFESYDNLLKKISKKCILEFKQLESVYNFDIGDELEMALVTILRDFLPSKYGVVRGFVVDKNGEKAGDDIIIFDQNNFPTLRFLNKDNIFLKQQVPIESVLAYIEVKNTLDEDTLIKALEQVKNVKKLCYKRILKIDGFLPYEENNSFSNEYSHSGKNEPLIKNPVYGMIFSRYSNDIQGNRIMESTSENNENVSLFASKVLSDNDERIKEYSFCCPDTIIFGDSNIAMPSEKYTSIDGKEQIGTTRFFSGIKDRTQYKIEKCNENSYGIALAHLMMALNYIELDDMPWENIFGCDKNVSGRYVEANISDFNTFKGDNDI